MRGSGANWLRSGLLALFALASLGGAPAATAHAVDRESGAAIRALCDDQRPDSGRTDPDACCDFCLTQGLDGLAPPEAGFSRLPPQFARSASLAFWLGRVLDETPDNLRSRAPPVAAD
jgi:hypothetical protein